MIIAIIKLTRAATAIIARAMKFLVGKSSGKVINEMGKYLHKKITGTKSQPKAKWYDQKNLKQYYLAVLRLERINTDEVLEDLDDQIEIRRNNIIRSLHRMANVVTTAGLLLAGFKLRATMTIILTIVGYISEEDDLAYSASSLLVPSSYVIKVAMFLLVLLKGAEEKWAKQITEEAEPMLSVGACLMSALTHSELKAIAEIDKPELKEIFDHNAIIRRKIRINRAAWLSIRFFTIALLLKRINLICGVKTGLLFLFLQLLDLPKTSAVPDTIYKMSIKAGYQYTIVQYAMAVNYNDSHRDNDFIKVLEGFRIFGEMISDVKRYGVSWKYCARLLSRHEISPYWKEQGLNENDLHTISVEAKDPDKERTTVTEGLDITSIVGAPSMIDKHINKTSFARQDDNMHCKAIHKRLGANKKNPTLGGLISQLLYMVANFGYLTSRHSKQTKIKKALMTEGTAGEFAKRTILESVWKENTSESLDMWMMLVDEIILYLQTEIAIPDKLFRYMMYRKREVLPVDENGDVKVTRLIQAAGLEMRIPDAVVFGDFNETMVSERANTFSDIGMRIDHELPIFCDPWERDWKIVADFSDFDGHQHPMHMMNCKYVRQIANLTCLKDAAETVENNLYLSAKYKLHVERKVDTNWGISVQMMGQLASGDIVTSDDNTMRACGFIYMTLADARHEMALPKQHPEMDPVGKGMGDDIAIKGNIFTDPTSIGASAYKQAARLGYNLKEMLHYESGFYGDNTVRLGHSVETVTLLGEGYKITVPAITRPEARLYGKMFKCAELPNVFNEKAANVIISKMNSYMSMLWGMPEVTMLAMGVIMVVVTLVDDRHWKYDTEEDTKDRDIPYNWRNMALDMNTISEIGPLESTTGIHFDSAPHFIVNPNRQELCEEVNKWLIAIIKRRCEEHLGISSEEYCDDLYSRGIFHRNKAFEVFRNLVGSSVNIVCETQPVPSSVQVFPPAFCSHIAPRDTVVLRKDVQFICEDCALGGQRNTSKKYRIVLGEAAMANKITKTDEQRMMSTITLGSIERWSENIKDHDQLPGAYYAGEEEEDKSNDEEYLMQAASTQKEIKKIKQ